MPNRILVVDDCHYVADASARLIAVCGYETMAVYDGREAIEQAASFAPDMVLMDIAMPELDGYEAATLIRRDPGTSNVLLVAVTCLNQEQDRQRALASGFDLHVPKPVSFTTLLGLLALLQKRPSARGTGISPVFIAAEGGTGVSPVRLAGKLSPDPRD